jgi:hypothetical protein
MGDDIKKREDLTEDETTQKLSTADLAAAREVTPLTPIEADAQQIEVRGNVLAAKEVGRAGTQTAATAPAMAKETGPLFLSGEANDLRARWDAIQVAFVDEPRRAVAQADNLVAGTMKRLAEIFAEERSKLESQWDQGENISTEDLRLALRRYRSFFGRLLSI